MQLRRLDGILSDLRSIRKRFEQELSEVGLRIARHVPRTLDILKRKVFISLHPDWSEEEVAQCIEACRAAAKEALAV